MTFVIAEPCIGTKDTACVDACPVDCIHPKKETTYEDSRPAFDDVSQLYIDPIECIDCGACVPVCPVSAIFALDDLPEKWKHFTEINASYVQGSKFYRRNGASTRRQNSDIHRSLPAAPAEKPAPQPFVCSFGENGAFEYVDFRCVRPAINNLVRNRRMNPKLLDQRFARGRVEEHLERRLDRGV